ncbi:MAG: DNA cytosine methyltransferase, partial [Mesorhizobium sp.]
MPTYSVVDIFAGPGGLAEGFSSVSGADGKRAFKIALSIEKDKAAHSTLQLRSFLRQFGNSLPESYYDLINQGGDIPDWSKQYP